MSKNHPDIIAPPPIIYVGAILTTLVFHKTFPYPLTNNTNYKWVGWGLISSSIMLITWCFQQFRRWQTHVDPYKPATTIIQTGPYRFSRNPIYLAMTLFFIGVTLVVNTIWGILWVWPTLRLMQKGVIEKEEEYLTQTFGEPYTAYKKRTRRWL